MPERVPEQLAPERELASLRNEHLGTTNQGGAGPGGRWLGASGTAASSGSRKRIRMRKRKYCY